MDIKFKKLIGLTEFTFNVQAEGLKDFFEKVSVYEDIPVEGPNGEKDLKIAFRTTTQGHKYYSVICKSAKQEFKFGQSTDNVSMFPKGWEPIYEGQAQDASAPATGGLGQQQQQYVNQNQAPAQQQQPGLGQQAPNQNIAPQQTYEPAATQQAPAAQQTQQAPAAQQTQQAPAQQAPAAGQTPPPAGNNPQVNDVLAKYGIGQ
tara:strand:+ start:67866 stop:68474 length:609 start_codon:yes stop_codon:yes gene_type:complete